MATKFTPGELRLETGGGLAYVCLAASAPGAVSVAEAMACLLLQRVLGTGPGVKYGGCQGVLGQVAAATGGNVAASGERLTGGWRELCIVASVVFRYLPDVQ